MEKMGHRQMVRFSGQVPLHGPALGATWWAPPQPLEVCNSAVSLLGWRRQHPRGTDTLPPDTLLRDHHQTHSTDEDTETRTGGHVPQLHCGKGQSQDSNPVGLSIPHAPRCSAGAVCV